MCEEILKLNKEKADMSNYLADTTRRYKGSVQLRKIWPGSLHKYLPPEPVKIPKKSKEQMDELRQFCSIPLFLEQKDIGIINQKKQDFH